MQAFIGMIKITVGLVICGCAIAVELSWLALCFGSVIVGILMLIFAPYLLLLPFSLIAAPGYSFLYFGYKDLGGNPYKRLQKELSNLGITHFHSILDSEDFRGNYLPQNLKMSTKYENNKETLVLPELDSQKQYTSFLAAVRHFWDENDLIHQSNKGYFFRPKRKQEEDPLDCELPF